MKVQDLIELLQAENPEAEVHFSYNYGDHWRTQVAPKVESVEVGYVTYSEYHRMHKVADEDAFDYDGETGEPDVNGNEVVIIG